MSQFSKIKGSVVTTMSYSTQREGEGEGRRVRERRVEGRGCESVCEREREGCLSK